VPLNPSPPHPIRLPQVVAIGTDEQECKKLEKSFKERVTTAVCDAKDMKQVCVSGGGASLQRSAEGRGQPFTA
jgi:hypothetical protein